MNPNDRPPITIDVAALAGQPIGTTKNYGGNVGDYEIVGDPQKVTGRCAACAGDVETSDEYVIRYAVDRQPGGIFHKRCDPAIAEPNNWYDPTGEGAEEL